MPDEPTYVATCPECDFHTEPTTIQRGVALMDKHFEETGHKRPPKA